MEWNEKKRNLKKQKMRIQDGNCKKRRLKMSFRAEGRWILPPDEGLYDNVQASYGTFDKDFKDLADDCTVHEKKVIPENTQSLKAALYR